MRENIAVVSLPNTRVVFIALGLHHNPTRNFISRDLSPDKAFIPHECRLRYADAREQAANSIAEIKNMWENPIVGEGCFNPRCHSNADAAILIGYI